MELGPFCAKCGEEYEDFQWGVWLWSPGDYWEWLCNECADQELTTEG